MHWGKAETPIGQEKIIAREAQPGGCGQNEVCKFILLNKGALANC